MSKNPEPQHSIASFLFSMPRMATTLGHEDFTQALLDMKSSDIDENPGKLYEIMQFRGQTSQLGIRDSQNKKLPPLGSVLLDLLNKEEKSHSGHNSPEGVALLLNEIYVQNNGQTKAERLKFCKNLLDSLESVVEKHQDSGEVEKKYNRMVHSLNEDLQAVAQISYSIDKRAYKAATEAREVMGGKKTTTTQPLKNPDPLVIHL